jgi:predicted nucleic acid-binding protein
MNIYVDTSAFYSLADVGDRYHAQSLDLFELHVEDSRLYTSDLVLAETWSLMRGRLGRRAALQWWSGVRSGVVEILFGRPVDLEAAWRIVQQYDDQDLSLVDCVSFAIMERFGLEIAFAYDHHFSLYRFGRQANRSFQLLA